MIVLGVYPWTTKNRPEDINRMLYARRTATICLSCFLFFPRFRKFHKYILLDGLTSNTRGYFASCVVFFRAPQGRGKMRAMSKMSASIIC